MTKQKNNDWEHLWKREYSLFYGHTCCRAWVRVLKKECGAASDARGEGAGGWFSQYGTAGMLEKLKEKIRHAVLHEPVWVSAVETEMHETGKTFVAFGKKRFSEKMPVSALVQAYHEFYGLFERYTQSLWLTFYVPDVCSALFQELAQKKSPENPLPFIEAFSHPEKRVGVLAIADYFSKETNREKRIGFIKKKFPWLGNIDAFVEPLTDTQIADYVDSFVSTEQKTEKKETKTEHKAMRRWNLSPEERLLISVFQRSLYFKDQRDVYRRKAYYAARPFLRVLEKKLGLTLSELGYLLPEDLSAAEENPSALRSLIEQRKQGYLIEIVGGTEKIRAGADTLRDFVDFADVNSPAAAGGIGGTGSSSVTGICGSSGTARGIVTVVASRNDLEHFPDGGVLVSISTNPDYVPAMHKAAAIVTDEGGIGAHAAIIAREMKKPCVVGTKCATKLFKDGDLVEVDATSGIVRKLKPKNI